MSSNVVYDRQGWRPAEKCPSVTSSSSTSWQKEIGSSIELQPLITVDGDAITEHSQTGPRFPSRLRLSAQPRAKISHH